MVVKYAPPPPAPSCLERPHGTASVTLREVDVVSSVGPSVTWQVESFDGCWIRDVDLEHGNVGIQVSVGGAGEGWMMVQSREPR